MQSATGYIALGDTEKDIEFSSTRCDCCGRNLAGYRHHMILMED